MSTCATENGTLTDGVAGRLDDDPYTDRLVVELWSRASRLSVESLRSMLMRRRCHGTQGKENSRFLRVVWAGGVVERVVYLPVREDGFFLNIPVSLSLTDFFGSRRSDGSRSKLRSEPALTLGIKACR